MGGVDVSEIFLDVYAQDLRMVGGLSPYSLHLRSLFHQYEVKNCSVRQKTINNEYFQFWHGVLDFFQVFLNVFVLLWSKTDLSWWVRIPRCGGFQY
jgi:hypothetical protein